VKLLVCNKSAFDAWLFAGSEIPNPRIQLTSFEHPLDVQRLSHTPFVQTLGEIETSRQVKIGDLISQVTGEPPVTYYGRDGLVTKEFSHEVSKAAGWRLYCKQATTEALDPERTLNEYDIQDSDMLLIDRWSWLAGYDVYPSQLQRVKDFSEIVLTKDDIAGDLQQQTEGSRRLNEEYSSRKRAIVLYSDEHFGLSTYVRYNFASLDMMTGSSLDVFMIEQPTRTDGISTREYWKESLATDAYNLLHFTGLTKYKPYEQADSYTISRMLRLTPEALPCVVLFRKLASDEKIVITLSNGDPDSLREFFRRLASVVRIAEQSVYNSKMATLERPNFSTESWQQLDLSRFDSIKDPVERGRAKSAAYLAYLNSEEAARKQAQEQDTNYAWLRAQEAIRTDFSSFREEFIKQWQVN
jgi:hypothetical protein